MFRESRHWAHGSSSSARAGAGLTSFVALSKLRSTELRLQLHRPGGCWRDRDAAPRCAALFNDFHVKQAGGRIEAAALKAVIGCLQSQARADAVLYLHLAVAVSSAGTFCPSNPCIKTCLMLRWQEWPA